jgi:predicted metal-dependent peptidase
MSNHKANRESLGKIRTATQRLLRHYRFHAKVLERFVVESQPDVPTMAVTIRDRKLRLLFNAEFVQGLSMDELVGVLLHEVHHVLLGHLQVDLDQYPDRWARLVAEEITVNEFILHPLPDDPITLDLFPDFPALESTQQRYRRLEKEHERFMIAGPTEVLEVGDGVTSTSRSIFDPLDGWLPGDLSRHEIEAVLKVAVQDAAVAAGPGAMSPSLAQTLKRQGFGCLSRSESVALSVTERGRLPWVQLLRRYVGRALRIGPDYRRPPRRMPDRVGQVPGRRHRAGTPRITAVIDTSGSLTDELLERISSELGGLASRFRVSVVECDAKIRRFYPFRPIEEVQGRGGTDLRPPFEAAMLRKLKPDLMIYFTDGFGPAPETAPRIPVVWCLTDGGEMPAPWGLEVRMTED